ncbi:UNVERIFIED_CONTAM: hypothetical protein RF653_08440 [Kocuria sp. CPCC 205316]|uniref:hypothetical protein n=1 Tax=Kocuria TaxID=57493 RepID=UPI0036DE0237
MILDLSCTSSTRGPTARTARTVLGGLLLAGILTGCGAAGATDDTAAEALEASTVVELETPQEVRAKDLPSAAPVAADAPEVEPIEAVLEAQEAFVPSDRPAPADPANPESSAELGGENGPAELDPAVVAAAEESATGAALQEVIASLAEFEHQGWEQRGTPVVVGDPVSAPLPTDDGEAVRVTVCLDASEVTVVDREGVVVSGKQKDRKALHNYDLFRQPGQSWQVVQHGFPDDPTC